ncbi:hypothetical protein GTN66_01525, partial [bacterium]|nr:hypothetical protein [bacterium]NIO73090.1 hypothetical protein [bacterium]
MAHVYKYVEGLENPLFRAVFENRGGETADFVDVDELAKMELNMSDVNIENGD